MIGDIITTLVGLIAVGGGVFIGNLWGRIRGEAAGRQSAFDEIQHAQDEAYRKTRERADEAPRHISSHDARDFLRNRQGNDQ